MTGDEMKAARKRLGWSTYQMGDALRLSGTTERSAQRVREMEKGQRDISGPVSVAVEAFMRQARDLIIFSQ